MNIHGQSKLPTVKQLQIEDFIKYNKIDILHMQEIETDPENFPIVILYPLLIISYPTIVELSMELQASSEVISLLIMSDVTLLVVE